MLQILGIAFVGVICYQIVKHAKPDIAILVLIATGAIILITLSDYISEAISVFSNLSDTAGLTGTVFSALLKIIGIGYITEYSANLCNDADCSGIAKKIELGGKLVIFIMAMPIITSIITTIGEII